MACQDKANMSRNSFYKVYNTETWLRDFSIYRIGDHETDLICILSVKWMFKFILTAITGIFNTYTCIQNLENGLFLLPAKEDGEQPTEGKNYLHKSRTMMRVPHCNKSWREISLCVMLAQDQTIRVTVLMSGSRAELIRYGYWSCWIYSTLTVIYAGKVRHGWYDWKKTRHKLLPMLEKVYRNRHPRW